jgi:maltose operon protein
MRRCSILVAAVALAMAGCATPRATVMESFAAATTCCRSMAEFRYGPLAGDAAVSFELDAKSPAFQFATGKSYFRAFQLPDPVRGYTLRVRSFMMGDHIDAAYLFFPQLITLDAQYNVVRSSKPEDFMLHRATYAETAKETWGLPWVLEGKLAFTSANAAERYLVVLTTDELMQRRTSMETLRVAPIILPGLVTAVPTGKREVLIPHAPAGHLNISFVR